MSWLFKDPVVIMKENHVLTKDPVVTVAWLNFNQAHSNSKKWPKKIKLPQMKFFSQKTNKVFMIPIHSAKLRKKILQQI